ncbi:hypothetical protein [Burkholderia ubonensis]|uniref:hypothetical protein n=1 Tax=Burkholderia ubonensis TaxID=101571 RepID=UPI000AD09A88|nr:hypothetical protein [Burkholderia ubonensis]
MKKIAINELELLYGLNEGRSGTLEDAISVLQIAAMANRAYFIIKFDGERAGKRFTAIFNAPNIFGGIIRMDGDDMGECIDYVLSEIVNLKRDGKIK